MRYGLDYESDGDDFSTTPTSRRRLRHRATPLLNTITNTTSLPPNNYNASSLLAASYGNSNDPMLYNTDRLGLSTEQSSASMLSVAVYRVMEVVRNTVRRVANTPTAFRQTYTKWRISPDLEPTEFYNNNDSRGINGTSKTSPMRLRSRRTLGGSEDTVQHNTIDHNLGEEADICCS